MTINAMSLADTARLNLGYRNNAYLYMPQVHVSALLETGPLVPGEGK